MALKGFPFALSATRSTCDGASNKSRMFWFSPSFLPKRPRDRLPRRWKQPDSAVRMDRTRCRSLPREAHRRCTLVHLDFNASCRLVSASPFASASDACFTVASEGTRRWVEAEDAAKK